MAQSALLNVMVQSATKAGRALGREFRNIENSQNSKKNMTQHVNGEVEKILKTMKYELQNARKNCAFITPMENENNTEKENKWIISPLDGKNNFMQSIPIFCVSVTLEYNQELRASVIYNPITEELYTTEKGQGAFCNDKRIRVSSKQKIENAAIAMENTKYATENMHRIIGCKTINLAWVAMGRFDGYVAQNLKIYELAAGMMLIREAGGFVSAGGNKQSIFKTGNIIAGGEHIHNALCKIHNLDI